MSLMKKLFNQIFLLRKSKTDKGLATVYLLITIDGARTEITTGRQCDPKKWLSTTGRLSGKTEKTRYVNAYPLSENHFFRSCRVIGAYLFFFMNGV